MNAWWLAGGLIVLASVVAEVLAHDASHSIYWWHDVPGFDFLFGAAGCAAIVVISKALGSIWLQRPEDTYDRQADA